MAIAFLVLVLFPHPVSSAKAAQTATTTPAIATSTPIVRNIAYYSELYGVDYSLAKNIAWCESEYDPSAKNASSTASGLYQFLTGTWNHYALLHWGTLTGHDRNDYGDSAELGVWVIANYGTTDWDASASCWL